MNKSVLKNIYIPRVVFEKDKVFWENKLSSFQKNFSPQTHQAGEDKKNSIIKIVIPPQLGSLLRTACGDSEYQLQVLILSAINFLIYTYTQRKKIVVGTTIVAQDDQSNLRLFAIKSECNQNTTVNDLVGAVDAGLEQAKQSANLCAVTELMHTNQTPIEGIFAAIFDACLFLSSPQTNPFFLFNNSKDIFSLTITNTHFFLVLGTDSNVFIEPELFSSHFINTCKQFVENPGALLAVTDFLVTL